jgi:ferritin-like metal-binding protein YciE
MDTDKARQKIVQYLNEAHAHELALVRVLQSQIAMTPRGSYRSAIESHLEETRDHAERVQARLQELGEAVNPGNALVGLAETVIGQVIALGKTPLDLLRGTGGEEKVLKNAKDSAAAEALEIATYLAIERLARRAGDRETATLAASIREDEEQMLERLRQEIPRLTDAVVGAEAEGEPSYDVTRTGAADAVRGTARQARKVPGVAQAEGEVKGAAASEDALAIARYDQRTADEIVKALPGLSQIELAKVDAYERKRENRSTVLERIASLRGDEPWAGYDELNVRDVLAVLGEGDEARARQVLAYERAHKNRAGVLRAAERERASA